RVPLVRQPLAKKVASARFRCTVARSRAATVARPPNRRRPSLTPPIAFGPPSWGPGRRAIIDSDETPAPSVRDRRPRAPDGRVRGHGDRAEVRDWANRRGGGVPRRRAAADRRAAALGSGRVARSGSGRDTRHHAAHAVGPAPAMAVRGA